MEFRMHTAATGQLRRTEMPNVYAGKKLAKLFERS